MKLPFNKVKGMVFGWMLGAVAIVAPFQRAAGNINLELRPMNNATGVGCPIALGLYGISDNRTIQTISAIQVILNWDIARVQLVNASNVGGPTWLSSGFGSNPYHLNDSLSDGDAMWIGLAPLGAQNTIQVSPSPGTLLTTFNFTAVAGTQPTTAVTIALNGGNPVGHTIVYSGAMPNTNITGTLTGSTIQVSTCAGDATHNGFVNVDDLLVVINHWGMCPGSQLCCPGDQNANGFVNVDDLLLVINGWGACP